MGNMAATVTAAQQVIVDEVSLELELEMALPMGLLLVESVREQLVATPPPTGPKRRLAVFFVADALPVAPKRCSGALGVLKPLSNCPSSGVASRSARRLLLRVILPQILRNFSLTGLRIDSFKVVLMLAKEHIESSAVSLPRNVDASATAMELLLVRNVLIIGVRSATKLMERLSVLVIDPVRMSFGFLVLAGRANESTDIRETLSKLSRLRFKSFSPLDIKSSVSMSHSLIVSIVSNFVGAFKIGEMVSVVA